MPLSRTKLTGSYENRMNEKKLIDSTSPLKRAAASFLPPDYGWKALFLMLLYNFITFNGTRLFNSHRYHFSMETFLDRAIPFVKEFVIIYIPVAFLQWIIGYYMISRDSRDNCITLVGGEMIAKSICLICFLLLPTTMVRADITGTDFLNRCVRYIYEIDPADNLFPSIHCLESWVIFRSTFYLRSLPKWLKHLHFIIALLVFASTLFVKQHVIADVIGGVIAVEIGLLIMKKVIRKQ